MNEWLLIIGMFSATFSIRFVMFAMAGKFKFPMWMEKSLRFVPPTVLTAIIVPMVVMPQGYIDVSITNPYLISAIAAFLIAYFTKNLLQTIGFGMLFFFALKWLLESMI
ncbi:MAG: AzlD domain-containing protein [Aliivibrio sp.]|uniref:AzlD domain-containing protein n=1 Tax=Aliivibrio sp. TaxID=1872443 RepID=UPI001A45D580|nr:AzlD domain-containing protein [Aliivibrio sp.]